jgi:hypothetical protein
MVTPPEAVPAVLAQKLAHDTWQFFGGLSESLSTSLYPNRNMIDTALA